MTISTMVTDRPSAISTSCTAPVDEDGVVAGDLDRHALGQVLLQLGDGGLDAGRNVQRVGLRLADDADADAGLAVGAQRGLADIAGRA